MVDVVVTVLMLLTIVIGTIWLFRPGTSKLYKKFSLIPFKDEGK